MTVVNNKIPLNSSLHPEIDLATSKFKSIKSPIVRLYAEINNYLEVKDYPSAHKLISSFKEFSTKKNTLPLIAPLEIKLFLEAASKENKKSPEFINQLIEKLLALPDVLPLKNSKIKNFYYRECAEIFSQSLNFFSTLTFPNKPTEQIKNNFLALRGQFETFIRRFDPDSNTSAHRSLKLELLYFQAIEDLLTLPVDEFLNNSINAFNKFKRTNQRDKQTALQLGFLITDKTLSSIKEWRSTYFEITEGESYEEEEEFESNNPDQNLISDEDLLKELNLKIISDDLEFGWQGIDGTTEGLQHLTNHYSRRVGKVCERMLDFLEKTPNTSTKLMAKVTDHLRTLALYQKFSNDPFAAMPLESPDIPVEQHEKHLKYLKRKMAMSEIRVPKNELN